MHPVPLSIAVSSWHASLMLSHTCASFHTHPTDPKIKPGRLNVQLNSRNRDYMKHVSVSIHIGIRRLGNTHTPALLLIQP